MTNVFEYKGYCTRIHYSAEDNVLYGKIEGIVDLVDFESSSVEEIETDFHKAVDEDVKKEGKPHILVQYEKLDEIDQVKADAFIQGLLSADKYAQKRHA